MYPREKLQAEENTMYKGTGERASLTHGEANRSSWLEATKQWEKQNEEKKRKVQKPYMSFMKFRP